MSEITSVKDIVDLLKDRGARYGNFAEQAKIGQALKNVLWLHDNWNNLSDDQKEAVEMMCVKLARIINGDPDYVDNWDDIEGYARLVSRRLRGM